LGAEIQGTVDLEWAKILFPVRTERRVFKDSLILRNSHLVCLDLANTSIPQLNAQNARFDGSVSLHNGATVKGGVDLMGAKIEGDLECRSGRFFTENKEWALKARGLPLRGAFFWAAKSSLLEEVWISRSRK